MKRLGDVTIFKQVGFIDGFKAFFRYFRHGIHLVKAKLQHQEAVCGEKIVSTVSSQLSWSYFKEIIYWETPGNIVDYNMPISHKMLDILMFNIWTQVFCDLWHKKLRYIEPRNTCLRATHMQARTIRKGNQNDCCFRVFHG